MKKNNISLLSVLFVLLFLQSCMKDTCEQMTTWVEVTPVYKTQAEIDAVTIQSEAPRALQKPGKIYFYNNFIFINELREGVHVIDNSDPHNPENIGFINIEGNADIAIKDGRLYADSYTSLWVVDVSNPENVTTIKRNTDFFAPLWQGNDGRILVYNETEKKTEMTTCETRDAMVSGNGGGWFGGFDDFAVNLEAAGSAGGGGAGVGGSMARFTLVDDYLYTVSQTDMRVISISNPDEPVLSNTINLGWGIETIIPHEDKLFIGSNSGMQIWDNSNPQAPTFLSEFQHARACDPVFVKDNYAYVTLRDGSFCEGFNNQLDLIDITDIRNPSLEKTFQMDNPHGLSIDGDNLFLCEGESGLKVFDIEDPKKLGNKKIDHVKNVFAYDVIAVPGASDVLLMIGEDGFFQYDYSNPRKLKEISRIVVQ